MLEKDPVKSVVAKPKAGKAKTAIPAVRKSAARKTGAGIADLQARIQQRAYELWELDGRPEGRDHAHWHQAERELSGAQAAR